MNIYKPQIYLASSSPRRQLLLDQINIRYKVLLPIIKESPQTRESPVDYAIRIAIEKARYGLNMLNESNHSQHMFSQYKFSQHKLPVLGADTVIALKNKIIGKPGHKADSLNILEQLSGKSHDVITAVALVTEKKEHSVVCRSVVSTSTVTFRQITTEERERYWSSKEPQDKAGSYAIQGMGAIFISNLSGSYSGVMGLPLFETANILQEAGIKIV